VSDTTEPTLDVAADVAPVDTAPVIPPTTPAQATTARGRGRRGPATSGILVRTAGGIGAVGVKELRGRMRGRRAFAILTGYLILLAAFAWMVELMMERSYSTSFGGSAAFATAAIGQGIFAGVLMLETLVVVFLATMATAGSISLEREKQTLEMLAATPITSFAIVLGKLLSALIYVWLLIAASIPLTAIVFVFGGVAPDDLVRGYIVLIVTALGFGAFGLFCSSLVKRTQAATAIALFGVLTISMGTLFVIVFWTSLATPVSVRDSGTLKGSPPDVLSYINPFIAQADVAPAEVLCATDSTLNAYCKFRSTFVLPNTGPVFGLDDNSGGGIAPAIDVAPAILPAKGVPANGVNIDRSILVAIDGVAPNDVLPPPGDVVAFGSTSESIWEKTVVAWSILALVFLLLSVQFVSPTRRWRLRRGPSPVPSPEAD
jgi:ABC-type transport system involved in multi-copper enzyme maturation permease subunit